MYEKGSCSTGLQTVGFDVFRRNVSDVVDGGSGTTELEGDFTHSDVMGTLGVVIVVVEGTVGGGIVLEEVVDVVLNGLDRAESGIAGDAMTECFPASGVLLISVGKEDVGPLMHVIPRTGTGWDALEV